MSASDERARDPRSGSALRVLIVDDELLARQRIEDLLRHEPDVAIVGLVDNGRTAVEAIRAGQPDLVFLDVQMPGLTGIEVAREIGADAMPATIFVTAYDQYALQAFDVAALDYLVKPFDDDRFEQAFRRARRAVELAQIGALSMRLRDLLGGQPASQPVARTAAEPARRAAPDPAGAPYLERIAVELRGQLRVVPVADIDSITSSGPYVELHVGEKTYLLRERMQTLEERLDPQRFSRIHRSAIVRLAAIEAMTRDPGGDYAVRLKGGAELPVSRNRVESLERWIGLKR